MSLQFGRLSLEKPRAVTSYMHKFWGVNILFCNPAYSDVISSMEINCFLLTKKRNSFRSHGKNDWLQVAFWLSNRQEVRYCAVAAGIYCDSLESCMEM